MWHLVWTNPKLRFQSIQKKLPQTWGWNPRQTWKKRQYIHLMTAYIEIKAWNLICNKSVWGFLLPYMLPFLMCSTPERHWWGFESGFPVLAQASNLLPALALARFFFSKLTKQIALFFSSGSNSESRLLVRGSLVGSFIGSRTNLFPPLSSYEHWIAAGC